MSLASGIRYFNEHIDRKQNGVRSSGSQEMDFELTQVLDAQEIWISEVNYAAFAENAISILTVKPF
jgi:Fe(3+) dicitrate transport protein